MLLERFGTRPDCHLHNHLRREQAEQLVASKGARYVGSGKRAVMFIGASTDCGYKLAEQLDDHRYLRKAGVVSTIQLKDGMPRRA